MATTHEPFSDLEVTFATSDEPVDARLEQHYEADRRQAHGRRLAVALFWTSIAWILFPFVEALVVGALAPVVAALHLGLVVPMGLMVARRVWRAPDTASVDTAAVATTMIATVVTVAAHRLDTVTVGSAAVLDLFALVPIVHLAVVTRPAARVAVLGALVGVTIAAMGMFTATTPGQAVAMVAVSILTSAVAVVAGQAVERDLRRAHLARLRSDLAAHRLTHRNVELRHLSHVDTLTGLANRRSLDLRLLEVAEWSRAEGSSIAMVMIDVDHFKQFNDRYGHPAGDRCLAAVAAAARDQIRRKDDLVGRFGGEEFLAVLPGADLNGATRVAERIRAAVEALGIPHGANRGGVVTVSLGCTAEILTEGRSIDDLLGAADEQLYAAKRRGRNRVCPPPPPSDDDQSRRPRDVAA